MQAPGNGTFAGNHSLRRRAISFEVMRRFFAILAVGAGLAVLFALVLLVASHRSPRAAELRGRFQESLAGRELTLAFVVALTATVGSLYLSEIAHLEPCKLCWFQRIAMYPLALVLGIAAWRRDEGIRVYTVPMAVVGGAISTYHYLLQQFPSLDSGACSATVPCTAAYIWEFGFVSIPLMALAAFSLVLVLLAVARSNQRETMQPDPINEVIT